MSRTTSLSNQAIDRPFPRSALAKIGQYRHRWLLSPLVIACGFASMNVQAVANCDVEDGIVTFCEVEDDATGPSEFQLTDVGIESMFSIHNDSDYTLTLSQLTLTDANTNDIYFDDENTQAAGSSLIYLHKNDLGNIQWNKWNINLSKTHQLHTLFSMYTDISLDTPTNQPFLIVNKSYINVYADNFFHIMALSFQDETRGTDFNLNLIEINDSTLINSNTHSYKDRLEQGDETKYFMTTIFSLHPDLHIFRNAYNTTETIANFNINNSVLRAETLFMLELDTETKINRTNDRERLVFNFAGGSEGTFTNLASHAGSYLYVEISQDQPLPATYVDINLDNSTLTTGIYSSEHGSIAMNNTSLNLSYNAVFNYLGGCKADCSLYDYNTYLSEPEYSHFKPDEHFADSYIHAISLNSGSSLVFADTTRFNTLYIDNLSSDNTGTIVMNTKVGDLLSDKLYVDTATGKFNLRINDSGDEPTDLASTLELIYVNHGEANQFVLNNGNGVDMGAYTYELASSNNDDAYVWYLGTDGIPNGNGDGNGGGPGPNENGNGGNKPKTSPTTNGVLNMASAAQFILNDELTNHRKRRGEMNINNSGKANAWGRYIGSRMDLDRAAPTSYQLNRNGMELGFDWSTAFNNDRLIYGLSASYSDNNVKHHNGGKSKLDAYSIGLYATWFDHSNVYIDGVVKYLYFDNEARIRTTNGQRASADYKQNGIGASLEVGYQYTQGPAGNAFFIEPYGRISYATVNSKNFTFDSNLHAAIKSQYSFISEAGVSIGKAFTLENGVIAAPYIKAAIAHEFIDDNDISINRQHKFTNDFSGTRGHYGAGVNFAVGNEMSIYAEANYMKGSHVESPMNGTVGVRFNF